MFKYTDDNNGFLRRQSNRKHSERDLQNSIWPEDKGILTII